VAKIAGPVGRSPAAPGVRREFLPALRAARDYVNSARGAWLFAPDPACAAHVHSHKVNVSRGDKVLLATDGLLTLISDYHRYEPASLIGAAQKNGLQGLGEELRGIEAGDPDGANYPRFKKSDDATALLLRVAG